MKENLEMAIAMIKAAEMIKSATEFVLKGKESEKLADSEENNEGGCMRQPFVPYQGKVPWHSGSRAFVSRFFPGYGNYCGPNWTAGRRAGSLVFDQPPLDELDCCCYKHDIGYDSLDQLRLHNADLALRDCLLRIPSPNAWSIQSFVSEIHRSAYLFGLNMILIPYRKILLRKSDGESTAPSSKPSAESSSQS